MILPLLTEFDRIRQQAIITNHDEKEKRKHRMRILIEDILTGKGEIVFADEIKQDSADFTHSWNIYKDGKIIRKLKWGEQIKIEFRGNWYIPGDYERLLHKRT